MLFHSTVCCLDLMDNPMPVSVNVKAYLCVLHTLDGVNETKQTKKTQSCIKYLMVEVCFPLNLCKYNNLKVFILLK